MALILVALCLTAPSELADENRFDFFENRIRPVLVDRCYKCHGPDSARTEAASPKGGLRLDSRGGLLRGGGRGPAIVPGKPGESLLLRAISHTHQDPDLRMPPSGKLADSSIADFTAWIAMGAPDPREGTAAGETAALRAGRNARDFWSFKPPRPPPIPPVERSDRARTPIDAFILARMEAAGLEPAPEADRRTLIRRAAYDLTGLPPSADEIAAFEEDGSEEAFERAVDRFLASPRFGERWGRHWLDVARYADTKGYVYSDREEGRFVHSHVYRDWVIRAFNEDLPYDRFLLLQIAADRLVEDGGDARDLAALGFLTLGRRLLGNIHDIIDDRIDVVMRGTQALTVACARCHDHKFDPIPQRDYYSLYGVFNGSTERLVRLVKDQGKAPEYLAYEKEMRAREEKLQKTFEAKKASMVDRLRSKAGEYLVAVLDVESLPSEEFYAIRGPDDLNPVVVRQWQAYLFHARKEFHPVWAPWHAFEKIPAAEIAARAAGIIEGFASGGAGIGSGRRVNPLVLEALTRPLPASKPDVARAYGKLLDGIQTRWKSALEEAKKSGSAPPAALPDAAAEELREVLHAADSPAMVPPGSINEMEWFFDEGTRVEIAKLNAEIERWILASPASPPHSVILADRSEQRNARVFIRGNPSNRGEEVPRRYLEAIDGPEREPFALGSGRLEMARAIARPDNPLTARVMVNRIWLELFGAGLVRTPSDFGTRSEPPSHPDLLDYLACRFVAEGWSMKKAIRAMVLSRVYRQSCEADPLKLTADPENRLLGRMRRKRLDFEAMRDSLLAVSGELDLRMGGRPVDLAAAPAIPRRTVYGNVDRQFLPGFFRVFDVANPDQHSPQRHATTVPQQALYLMNSPFVVERARTLAARAAGSGEIPVERIRRLHRAVFSSEPSPRQIERALSFVAAVPPDPPSPPPPPPPAWRYGWGEFDETAGRVKGFSPLPHWTGEAWQGGPNWPDPKLGWVQIKADGGHAGNDRAHMAIRRWVAPRALAVSIAGKAAHRPKEGNGIHARIVSSRAGSLWDAAIHDKDAKAEVKDVRVEPGDTIDFVVDCKGDITSDEFEWAPVIREAAAEGEGAEWDAKKDFGGRPPPPPRPLSAWEMVAQALILSNEFVFVD